MKLRVSVLAAVSALLAATPAAAQKTGSIEIGAFTQFTNFDNSLPLGDALGIGGRIAVHALPVLSVEFDVARVAHNDANNRPMHLWLVYNVPPVSRAEILAGAGVVWNKYGGGYDGTESGIGGFVAVRHRFNDRLALRLQGQSDFVPRPTNEDQNVTFNGNWGIQLGVSLFLNRGVVRTP
jgi:hypothetical protein